MAIDRVLLVTAVRHAPNLNLANLNGRVGIFNRGYYTETQKTVSFYITSLVPFSLRSYGRNVHI